MQHVIGRLWRTRIDPTRAEDYRSFARSVSTPMFEGQRGFLGVMFGERADERIVITFWDSREAVGNLEASTGYQVTVDRLDATGLLVGRQTVETFEIESTSIDVKAAQLEEP